MGVTKDEDTDYSVSKTGVLERMYGKTRGGILSGLTISKNNIIFFLISILLGRVSLFGGLMPFGLAFYAASITSNVNRLITAAAVVIGMATGGARAELYTAFTFIALFTLFTKLLKNINEKEDLKYSAIGLVSAAVPQIIMAGFQGFLMYDVLIALFQSVLVFSMTYIFRRGVPLIEGIKNKSVLTNEEMISAAMIAAISLSGLGGIDVFGASLLNVLSILAVLLLTFKAGPGVGAAVGVIVGLVVNLSNPVTPMVIGSYAFCGLMAGLFRNLGKTGTAVGFILANAVLTLYINGSTEVIVHIKDIIPAAIMFVVIPKKIIEDVFGTFAIGAEVSNDKVSYSERIKELTVERLSNFARAFQELSKTFSEISQTKMVTNKQDISSLFDRVADKVCKDCSLCLHCWDRNFYNTYQVMFKIVENLEKKGWIDESDIPEYFMERCERIGEFVRQVNNVYELFKVDMVWKNRIGESRGLISQQLDGLSKVISSLAVEIESEIKFKADMEDALLSELRNKGIKAYDVVVFENKWGKYEVSIFHRGCAGANKCLDHIEEVASTVLGRQMIRDRNECIHNHRTGICNLKLVEEEIFNITTGMARSSKYENQVSGDNYSFMNTGAGKYILALSDGMGTGQAASSQSKAVISLLEHFMETGFDQDTAIKFINSILVLKSDDDSFATIDLSAIDLYNGKIEFVKIGLHQPL